MACYAGALSVLAVSSAGCADCGCCHGSGSHSTKVVKVSPERLEHDLAMAYNEFYVVTDLERHTDPDGHAYYTFLFSPRWPDYPFTHTEIGRVAATDVLMRQPEGVGPSGEWATLILVSSGSVQQVEPEIEIGHGGRHAGG
jgi:hypothetical protein